MVQIKRASIEDVDAITQLFDAYRIFYNNPSDPKKAKEFISDRLIKGDAVIFLCVADKNTAVGFVQLYPLFSSTRMRRLWLLNDLYVDRPYRGKGYSVELINKAKELCSLTNACGLILETAKDNTIGNTLYPKTGFRLDTEHHYYSWDSDQLENGAAL